MSFYFYSDFLNLNTFNIRCLKFEVILCPNNNLTRYLFTTLTSSKQKYPHVQLHKPTKRDFGLTSRLPLCNPSDTSSWRSDYRLCSRPVTIGKIKCLARGHGDLELEPSHGGTFPPFLATPALCGWENLWSQGRLSDSLPTLLSIN